MGESHLSYDEIEVELEVHWSVAEECFVEVEGELLQVHGVDCCRC